MTREQAHSVAVAVPPVGEAAASGTACAILCMALYEQEPKIAPSGVWRDMGTALRHLTPTQQTIYRAACFVVGIDIRQLR